MLFTCTRILSLRAPTPNPKFPPKYLGIRKCSTEFLNFKHKFESFTRNPNIFAASALLKETYKIPKGFEQAFTIYRTLLSANIRPDNFVFGALMTTYRKHQQDYKVIAMLRDMNEMKVLPVVFNDKCYTRY